MIGKKMSNPSSSRGRNNGGGMSSKSSKTQGSVPSPSIPEQAPIPYIKIQDNPKLLPNYTAALSVPLCIPENHPDPESYLDAIQAELELLLSTAALRYRYLKAELETLEKGEDKREREKKGKHMEKQPGSPGKKKRFEEKAKKEGSSSSKLFGNQSKLSKVKNASPATQLPTSSQHTDDSMEATSHTQLNQKDNPKLALPRNDTPSKFWLSVEPYCMPLTHEDIKLLDDLLEEYSGPLIPPIPDLGPHYSSQWAAEDIKDEQDNSNSNSKSKSRLNASQTSGLSNMLKKGEKLMGENVTGPLTQRLVSALMEENLIPDNITSTDNSNSGSENTSSDFASNRSSLPPMKNGISIERRVRKELIEQGILDLEDLPKEEDDEILSEIKRVRTELSAIAEYNSNGLKKLYSVAKDEMKRLEVKRKLDTVDQEIIETYKKILSAKQKRRPLTKQERDEVFRLTEEQKRLSDQLEALPVPGLGAIIGFN